MTASLHPTKRLADLLPYQLSVASNAVSSRIGARTFPDRFTQPV